LIAIILSVQKKNAPFCSLLHNMQYGKLGFARRRSDNGFDNFFTICNLVEYELESRSEYIKVILSLKSDQ